MPYEDLPRAESSDDPREHIQERKGLPLLGLRKDPPLLSKEENQDIIETNATIEELISLHKTMKAVSLEAVRRRYDRELQAEKERDQIQEEIEQCPNAIQQS